MSFVGSISRASLAALLLSGAAQADLLEVLKENGTITAEQYEQLKADQANEIQSTGGTKGLKFKKKDFSYQIGGRFYADFADYQEDETELVSGGEIRTARISLKGKYENWRFRTQYAFPNDNTVEARYIWLGYQWDNSIARAGRLVESAGLEDYTSSRFITFMERALPSLAFAGSFSEGVDYRWWNDNSHFYGSAILDRGKPANNAQADERFKWHARYTIAPINESDNVLHLGLWANYINPPADTSRTRARPEAHVDNTRFVDTGTITDVDGQVTGGLEFAWVGGPWSVQAEYSGRDVSRRNGDDINVDGYYAFVSWFVTGESRKYYHDYGSFDRVTPLKSTGAVELALRYSTLDATESTFGPGGEEHNITLGVNWFPRSNVRLSFNQVFASVEDRVDRSGATPVALPDEDIGISQVRFQIDF